jgi:hypothetical protein
MGRACSAHGEVRNTYKILVDMYVEQISPGIPFIDGRIIIMKWILKVTAFWDAVPCIPHYAPLKRRSTSMTLHSATSQEAVIFILTALRT